MKFFLWSLLCLLTFFNCEVCQAKKPQYMMKAKPPLVSQYIENLASRDKELASELKSLEEQHQKELDQTETMTLQIRKEFGEKGKELETEKEKKIATTKEEREKDIDEIKQQLEQAKQDLKANIKQIESEVEKQHAELELERMKKEEILVCQEKNRILQQVKEGEKRLLEKFLSREHKDRADLAQQKELETWKEKKREEVNTTFAFFFSLVSGDEEMSNLIKKREAKILEKIDSNNKDFVEQEINLFSMLQERQVAADRVLDEIALNEQESKKARFICFAELFQKSMAKIDVTPEIISLTAKNAINEIRYEESPEVLKEKAYLEKLAQSKEKLRLEQAKREELEKNIAQIKSESAMLKQTTTEDKKKIAELKNISLKTQEELEKKLETEIAKSLQLKKEVRSREDILETAKKNTKEKQSSIIRLKRDLEKTKRDLVNTQIEMRKTQNLKSNLASANIRLQRFVS